MSRTVTDIALQDPGRRRVQISPTRAEEGIPPTTATDRDVMMKRLLGTATALLVAAGVTVAVQATGVASPPAVTLDTLARDIERFESLREIKDVQRTYAHLAQFGRWDEMAALFAQGGTLQWGSQVGTGHENIRSWLEAE